MTASEISPRKYLRSTERAPWSDTVYADVDYHVGSEARVALVLRVALWTLALASFANFWLTSIPARSLGWALCDGFIFAGSALTLVFQRRLPIDKTVHILYWIAIQYIWWALLFGEGIIAAHEPAFHFWFITVATAIVFVFLGRSTFVMYVYVAIAIGSFVICEFALVRTTPLVSMDPDLMKTVGGINVTFSMIATLSLVFLFSRELAKAHSALTRSNDRLEELIVNMLPKSISDRLRSSGHTFADGYAECSVLFADIVGFTPLSSSIPPSDLVRLLDEIFSQFDVITERFGLEKIKTIGDAYMVASGLPDERPDHAQALVSLALSMRSVISEYAGLHLRIGINSGSVVAGVIGRKRFIYDLWGDTVNIASRMESHGVAGEIQVSEATKVLIDTEFETTSRGEIEIKGKGAMEVYLVVGRRIRPISEHARDTDGQRGSEPRIIGAVIKDIELP